PGSMTIRCGRSCYGITPTWDLRCAESTTPSPRGERLTNRAGMILTSQSWTLHVPAVRWEGQARGDNREPGDRPAAAHGLRCETAAWAFFSDRFSVRSGSLSRDCWM